MEQLFTQFLSLAGVSALITAVINTGKTFGLVPDGGAGKLSSILSFAAFIAMIAFKLFAPEVSISGLDAQAAQYANMLIYVLGFAVQLGLPAAFHKFLSGANVPVIGTSYSRG